MPNIDVFKTRKGEPALELDGVGIVDHDTGVSLERAAQRMHELQDENGQPLTGKALTDAAKEYADRSGLLVGKTTVSTEEAEAPPTVIDPAPASAPDPKE